MATAVKRLDLSVAALVEVAGRRYEVVPDREGGVTIEPPITAAGDVYAPRGTRAAAAEVFERLSVDVPFDDEGQRSTASVGELLSSGRSLSREPLPPLMR
jgi:hypothetical protein